MKDVLKAALCGMGAVLLGMVGVALLGALMLAPGIVMDAGFGVADKVIIAVQIPWIAMMFGGLIGVLKYLEDY